WGPRSAGGSDMPRTLFLKIFLWFGVVMVTVVVGTFIISEIKRPDRNGPPFRQPLEHLLSEYAKDAAAEYERGGKEALIAYLDRVESESNIRTFLFDGQLHELT